MLLPELIYRCPLGGAVGLFFTCIQCAGSGGSQVHLQFQQRKTWLWAPGRPSLSEDGRTAGENKTTTSVNIYLNQILLTWFPGFWFLGVVGHFLPLHHWRSPVQSKACQSSGRSSAAPPGRGVWCSSSAHCAQPWYVFAGRKEGRLIHYSSLWHLTLCNRGQRVEVCMWWLILISGVLLYKMGWTHKLKGLTSFFFMIIFFCNTFTA